MPSEIPDTGERIIPTAPGEISLVFSRHRFAYEYVRQFIEKKTVIDVGCGTGYGSKILAEKAVLVYGIDWDAEAITYCQKHYSAPNIRYMQMDAISLNLDRQFDGAVSFQVIEHVPDPHRFLQQLKLIVRPQGTIFISTPNVITPSPSKNINPFHFSEMNYVQFRQLLSQSFSTFEILGVDHATPSNLRDFLSKTPLYNLGKLLKRNSKLKKVATRALSMGSFKIIYSDIEREAADLLAVCRNS